jgi:hypothetical protein
LLHLTGIILIPAFSRAKSAGIVFTSSFLLFNESLMSMAKTGKDRAGSYHPPKGKPSKTVASKETEIVDDPIAKKYADEDDLPGNIHMRHPNRHVADKNEERNTKKNGMKTSGISTSSSGQESRASKTPLSEIIELNAETIKDLTTFTADHAISIYLPTHTSGVEVNEKMDYIAFKSAIQNATSALKAKNVSEADIKDIFAPAHQLLKDDTFWNSMSHGLALFLAKGFSKYHKMPVAPAEMVYVNSSFAMKPLVPVMLSRDYYYLLVISKKQSQLYRADAFGITPIPISEMPNGIEDVVHFENKDDQKLFRTGSSGAGGGANYHGIGAGKPDDKQNISLYLDEVDETLWKEILNREHKPLVLAGVEYLLPLFREVSQYNQIWPEVLTGNFEGTDLATLHARSMEIMKPYFDQPKKKALETYGNRSATELTSSIIDDVVPASYYGRIDTLFVSRNAELWGTFDEMNNDLKVHASRQEEDESLIDKTVMKTITNGGMVYEVNANEMPMGAETFAALMRY